MIRMMLALVMLVLVCGVVGCLEIKDPELEAMKLEASKALSVAMVEGLKLRAEFDVVVDMMIDVQARVDAGTIDLAYGLDTLKKLKESSAAITAKIVDADQIYNNALDKYNDYQKEGQGKGYSAWYLALMTLVNIAVGALRSRFQHGGWLRPE